MHAIKLFSALLAPWLSISALLMSPALAQVNGPGSSPASAFDVVLNLPGDEAVVTGAGFASIGGVSGQTTQLNVNDDGTVGRNFDALAGGEVNISGGTVGIGLSARSGSEVNISGGAVGRWFDAFSGSVVNVSGGTVDDTSSALAGSMMNISGGTVGRSFHALPGSAVNISGGTVGQRFWAIAGSDVELIGGEFRLNGADFSGSTITLADNDVLTGTLADGSSFIFSDDAVGDQIKNVTLTAVALPAADLIPIAINAPVTSGPSGLRAGQTLTLQPGGSLRDNFAAIDGSLNVEDGIVGEGAEVSNSEVNISGGIVGDNFGAFGSEVNISGGSLGSRFGAYSGSVLNISGGNLKYFSALDSEVNISGGTVVDNNLSFSGSHALSGSVVNISGGTLDNSFQTYSGGEVNISGGVVGDSFLTHSGSKVNISGGAVGDSFLAGSGSEVNISGGTVGRRFSAVSGSVVNILGSKFSIDGEELDILVPGEAFTITDRDVTLSGLLTDGEQFSFNLNSLGSRDNDFFAPDATLTVTLVSPVILGDVSLDGGVGISDIPAFIAILTTGEYQTEADCNQDDVTDFFDIHVFVDILFKAFERLGLK